MNFVVISQGYFFYSGRGQSTPVLPNASGKTPPFYPWRRNPMIFEHFLLDPDGHTKDWLNLLVTQGDKDNLQRCADILKVEINTIRQWGYRDKESQQAYLYRAIIVSTCMKDHRILKEWAEMAGQELHPRGTRAELEKLRKIKEVLEK